MKYLALLLALTTQAEGATLFDYFPHVGDKKLAAMLLRSDTRERMSMWVSDGKHSVEWYDPNTGKYQGSERFSVRDGWIILEAFDAIPANCIRAEIEDIGTGVIIPLPCSKGHYYAPVILPKDPWRIRNWISLPGVGRAYWEADFYPGETAVNPCSGESRAVLRQVEVWRSEYNYVTEWVRGTGTEPWDDRGNPVRPTVTKQWQVTLAPGIGVWTGQGPEWGLCLFSTWQWG